MATSALNPQPDILPAAVPKKQSFAYRSVLTLYRVVAIIVLYAVLVGILTYAFIMGFYAVNTTWAAPVILSSSDEKASTSCKSSSPAARPSKTSASTSPASKASSPR